MLHVKRYLKQLNKTEQPFMETFSKLFLAFFLAIRTVRLNSIAENKQF